MKIIKGQSYFLVKTQDLRYEDAFENYKFESIDIALDFMNEKFVKDIYGASHFIGGNEYIYEVKEVTEYEVDYKSDRDSLDEKDWYWSLKDGNQDE